MLNTHLIERFFRKGQFETLLAGLCANGLELPLPLKAGLLAAPLAVLALALRRVLQLTYGPTPLSRDMLAELLRGQQDDGSWCADTLATAAGAAALGLVLRDQPGLGDAQQVQVAAHRALMYLAAQQDEEGLFSSAQERYREDRALHSALVLYLLDGDGQFRAMTRYADLLTWFEQHECQLDGAASQLWQMARPPVTVSSAEPLLALAA